MRHHFGGGWGGGFGGHHHGGMGFGWFFPALLIGRLIGDAFEPRREQPWPAPQPPVSPPPAPAASAPARPAPVATGNVTCRSCQSAVAASFQYCPHCGSRLAPPACRYCNQSLKPGMTYCPHCGGPAK